MEDRRIPFCKDFRYSTCKFRDCIYVHGPELLENEYLKTGKDKRAQNNVKNVPDVHILRPANVHIKENLCSNLCIFRMGPALCAKALLG